MFRHLAILFILLFLPALFATAEPLSPVSVADTFLGFPYRPDGVIDEKGRHTLFADPQREFADPGFNCSGLVVSTCRLLLERDIPLADAKKDRLGDSGPDALPGEDWDFGWDLVLNLSEGLSPCVLLPGGTAAVPADALAERGFPLIDTESWKKILVLLKPGSLYLGSLNRPVDRPPYCHLYHHTLFILPEGERIWLYQSTVRNGTHKIDLSEPEGLERFISPYRTFDDERLFLIEVPLPTS